MKVRISTDQFNTDYSFVNSDVILMEKSEEIVRDKAVTDVFTNCWAIGLTTSGEIENIFFDGRDTGINGEGLVLVPEQALVRWVFKGVQSFSFKAFMLRRPWPLKSQTLSFIQSQDFSCELKAKSQELFFENQSLKEGNINQLIEDVAHLINAEGSNFDYEKNDLASNIKSLIDTRSDQNINLDDLSRELQVSKSYLIRIFKKKYLVTPGYYIQHRRIYSSIYHMLFNRLNTTEAGFESGYENLGHYYKYFKDKIGVSPSSYKTPNKDSK